jgi:hypothetical protein
MMMMQAVNVQFHMLFDELVEFVAEVCSRYQLDVELERFFPTVFHLVPRAANLVEEISRFGDVDRFWLLYKAPRSKKPERFMLNVGRQRGNRLAQAQLGAGARRPGAFKVLQSVARELKRRTTAGVWIEAPLGIGYTKGYRISPGAANASRAGDVELVSMVFTQSFHPDPPDPE